jgi:hypothetical protein
MEQQDKSRKRHFMRMDIQGERYPTKSLHLLIPRIEVSFIAHRRMIPSLRS